MLPINGPKFIIFEPFFGFMITIIILSAKGADKVNPNDLKIIAIKPKSEAENELIGELGDKHQISYWTPPTVRFTLIKGFIWETKAMDFLKELKDNNIEYRLYDSQKVIQLIQKQLAPKPTGRAKKFEWDKDFYNIHDIYGEMDRLEKENPKRVKVYNFGKSYEKFDMKAIKVFGNELKEKIVVIECGAHAREWLSPAFCMGVVNILMADPKLLENYDFLILPVFNVDGYNYTWTVWNGTEDFIKAPVWAQVWVQSVGIYRYWRKTRQDNTPIDQKYLQSKAHNITFQTFPQFCIGIDLNRNFPSPTFCAEQRTQNPCGATWCGETPLSAPEAKAYSEFLIPLKGKMFAYFSIHSFSQFLMFPYSYNTTQKCPNYSELKQLSEIAVNAMKKVDGKEFIFGNSPKLLYPVSGSTDDYVYGNLGVKYVWTIEMRPKQGDTFKENDNSSGFVLPNEQLKPAIEEVWAGIEAILQQLKTQSTDPAVTVMEEKTNSTSNSTPNNQYIDSIVTVLIVSVFVLIFKFF